MKAQPSLEILSTDEVAVISMATLEVLEETGVEVFEVEALELLKGAGAWVEGNRVRIPSRLVEQAISTSPDRITVCNRHLERVMLLEGRRCYFGTGSDCPYIIDPYTGIRRSTIDSDVANAVRLADALPNIDFVMSMAISSEYPKRVVDLYQFVTHVNNTTKPIVFTAHDKANLIKCLEMAAVVAGGEDKLARSPFVIHYSEPTTPLRHPKDAVEKLLLCAEKGIPLIYTPGVQAGATGPATVAGSIVCGNAEILSGLVIHQLKKPGAPFIHGGVITIMDMKSANYSLGGSPEWYLANAALRELSLSYGVPLFGTAGCTDAKLFDEQAGIEIGQNILMAAMIGANLVHDVGYMECGLTACLEQVVAGDEVIGMARRFMRGIDINADTMAVKVINRVGPGGNFLGDEHTFRHFREEHWIPGLLDRDFYSKWVAGGKKTMAQRANEKVISILKSHQAESLPENVLMELKEILTCFTSVAVG